MHRVTGDLIASGQASRALRAGDQMPRFTLTDLGGTSITSEELLSRGALVLTFYWGSWCPYCTLDLGALEKARPEFEKRGASLVAVSQQIGRVGSDCPVVGDLSFPLLCDRGGRLAARFGIRWTLPPDLQRIQRLSGADLEKFNGDASWTLPMPGRYVIGRSGTVAYSEINPDHTVRSEPSDLFPVVEALQRRTEG
jgi:peroxiredoxin